MKCSIVRHCLSWQAGRNPTILYIYNIYNIKLLEETVVMIWCCINKIKLNWIEKRRKYKKIECKYIYTDTYSHSLLVVCVCVRACVHECLCMCLCHEMCLKIMVGSCNKARPQEPEAERHRSRRSGPFAAIKSTEDLRPHISVICARSSQQEKEGGLRWGATAQGWKS